MLAQLSLFQQCPIQSQDVMQTWLHWRHQDAQLVQKHFLAFFHPKPNECLDFDLESCILMCTYTVVTHPCDIPPLAQARPMMLCIYTSIYDYIIRRKKTYDVIMMYCKDRYMEYYPSHENCLRSLVPRSFPASSSF